jgi:triosephosphate isomerase (TIM)
MVRLFLMDRNLMRKRIIAGNWKMNKTLDEAVQLARALSAEIKSNEQVDVVLCPPFTNLYAVYQVIKDTPIQMGAQNIYWEEKGAYTGEISSAMLKSVGCTFVILGHSERRQYFHETDETVNKKILSALKNQLIPIVCVGETLAERKSNHTEKVIETQIKGVFAGLSSEQAQKIVLAYEPVWAIGTGENATPQQAQQVHKFIRDLLINMYSSELAQSKRIQYGGSMKADNARELLAQPDVDGGLIGGASLDVNSFLGIIRA